ncbi:MAG: 2-hydroxy-3-oxopropionate reductase [Anaerolineae bacterium]|nr:2-hydroxy-3-oxopropionate reductase [Anaerolineae bacterium]MDW8098795.1 2-hydroxy-3-oxopropionate reductase [Anaerolineae bacterium]
MDKPTVGFIGLGIMGKPMALNILKAGFPLVVHNRSRGAVEEVVAAGAADGGSPKGVAQRAEIILTCLPDSPDVQSVIEGPNGVFEGISPGKVIVDMSTISPIVARNLAAKAEKLGAEMLDAPVSGGEIGARQGTLSIMVGGKPEVFERVLPVFQAMGKNIVRIGEAGAGQVAKACNQIIVALTIEAISEALVLAAKAGVDPARVREALLGGFAQSRVLEVHGQRILDRNFRPGFKARLHHKDLKIALDTGRAYGVPLLATSLVHELYASLMARGKSELDHSALAILIEELAGISVQLST